MEGTFLLPVEINIEFFFIFFFILFKLRKVNYDKCGDDRKKNTTIPLNQDGRSVQVVTRKLDLDQTSMTHTHTERHIRDQTQISVADFSLDDSDNIFKCPRNFRVPPWILP